MRFGIDQTEKTADRIRGDFLATLHELEARRQRATDLRYQLTQHLGTVAVSLVALGVAVALGGLALRLRARTRGPRMLRKRLRAFIRAWEHPGRLASRVEQRPLPLELARRSALAFTSALAAQLARGAATGIARRS